MIRTLLHLNQWRRLTLVVAIILTSPASLASNHTEYFIPDKHNYVVTQLPLWSSIEPNRQQQALLLNKTLANALSEQNLLSKFDSSTPNSISYQLLSQELISRYKSQDASSLAVLQRLIKISNAKHDFELANQALLKATQQLSPRSQLHQQLSLQRVNALIGMGNYELALNICKKNLQPNSGWRFLCSHYGSTLLESANNETLQDAYSQITQFKTTQPEQLNWQAELLADLANRLGNSSAAQQHCRDLASLQPSWPQRLFCVRIIGYEHIPAAWRMELNQSNDVAAKLAIYLNTGNQAALEFLREVEASALGGNDVHYREITVFALVDKRYKDAWHFATQNWEKQKFPYDGQLLKHAAYMHKIPFPTNKNDAAKVPFFENKSFKF